MNPSRRDFIKSAAAGTTGLALGTVGSSAPAVAREKSTGARVSFVTGTDRREMVYNAVKPFKKEIERGIEGKRILLKPNNVWDGNPLCASHPDELRGVLDLLKEITDRTIYIGESTASPKGTMFTFEEYGYFPLRREYNVELYDLNAGTSSTRWIMNQKGHPLSIEIIDDFLDPDVYIMSIARMKTHDSVVATLGFKNMLLGCPLNVMKSDPRFVRNQSEKSKMHQGAVGINVNMFELAKEVSPEFTVIDGVVGMEGNGPMGGTPVEQGIVLAGPDVVAVDRIGLELMEIDYEDVGYLQWCSNAGIGQGEREMIKVLGPDTKDYSINYRRHDRIDWQLGWKDGK
jgi:uncharacterized protein (DUF362 family)